MKSEKIRESDTEYRYAIYYTKSYNIFLAFLFFKYWLSSRFFWIFSASNSKICYFPYNISTLD